MVVVGIAPLVGVGWAIARGRSVLPAVGSGVGVAVGTLAIVAATASGAVPAAPVWLLGLVLGGPVATAWLAALASPRPSAE
ncbi:hypothetical protein ACH46_05250 [Gordonia phthalatica]|uniref:Uncharacterized protein n=1 Tax=Gordonia phthalatica TaxID=1136941 RepID=A0A0N7FUD1_9ACTN|nr:hypothetical protein ACH46_05250 [Gordonia phthalatica]